MTEMNEWPIPVPDPDFEAKRKAAFESYFEKTNAIAEAVKEEAAAEEREVGPLDALFAIADARDNDDDEPNLHMTDPGRWAALSAAIPGLLVESAGGACPYQSEGTIKGYPYYFRYRSGHASLKIGMPGTKPYGWDTVLWDASKQHGDDYDGFLEPEEFANLMIELVPQLERAPRWWRVPGNKVRFREVPDDITGDMKVEAYVTGEQDDTLCVAYTAEEAVERLTEMARSGVGGRVGDYSHLLGFDVDAIDPDDRVWPDPEPVFETTVATIGDVIGRD
ncbi:hypothetical protein [Aeromicrobium sp. 179-A 4D2 NHS]|uniref:hypothetical protein n=1 Tax=Aeromicrobium sp. 179-A 4D2 NHS TaxID=3142375 RepID=UPI00399F22E4